MLEYRIRWLLYNFYLFFAISYSFVWYCLPFDAVFDLLAVIGCYKQMMNKEFSKWMEKTCLWLAGGVIYVQKLDQVSKSDTEPSMCQNKHVCEI